MALHYFLETCIFGLEEEMPSIHYQILQLKS